MNEATSEGMQVVLEMPRILRTFATECRRNKVVVGDTFDDFAAHYFAGLAGCDLVPKGKGSTTTPPPIPPLPPTSDVVPEVAAVINPYADNQRVEDVPKDLNEEDAAAVRIQSVQKGRAARKQHEKQTADRNLGAHLREQKQRFLSGPRKAPVGEAHEVAIFEDSSSEDVFKVVFAVREVEGEGKVFVSELTEETLVSIVPPTCTIQAFWKACATNEADLFAFNDKDFPAVSFAVTVKSGRKSTAQAEIPLCDMSDPSAQKTYFTDPFV